MTERLVRITEAEVKPVGRVASEELRRRSGEWCIVDGSPRHLLLRRNDDARLRLAGELDHGVLFDVMALIAQSRWTGVLVVCGGGVTRAIVLDQGDVIDSTSDAKGERLFDVLLSRRLVTHDTLDELTRTAAIAGMSIPDALEESHILDDAELGRAFAQSARLVVLGALGTDTGSFSFSTESALARLRPGLPLTSLLMESAQQLDESAAIATVIETEHHIPEQRERAKATVPPELAVVYALCDGRRSVAEVARRAGLLGFEAHKTVHELLRLGLVSIKPPRPRGARYIAEIYSDALFVIHQRAEASCVGKELREGLNRFIAHNPPLAALLRDAGPLLDGSLVAERVARTLALRQVDAPIANLIRRLDELISFALFMASSLLGTATAAALRASVAERLAPLERASDSVVPPSDESATRVAERAQPELTPPLRSGTYAAVKISRSGSDG